MSSSVRQVDGDDEKAEQEKITSLFCVVILDI
jgi:hypothetical protein